MFELDRIVLLAVSAASMGLAMVVYHRAPDRVWNRLFTVHALAVSVWVFLNYLLQSASSAAEAAVWLRLTHPVVAVVICSCLDLAWVFPERITFAPRPRRVLLYIIGLVASAVAVAPNLYTSIELAYGTVTVEYGWPFMVFGVFTVGTLGYADYVLLKKSRQLSGLQQVQANYVLVGLLLGQTIAVVTMVLLPLVWENTYFSRWGSASYIFVILAMAYAIAKHRIVDLRVALRQLITYGMAVISVLTVAFLVLIIVQWGIGVSHPYTVLAYLLTGILIGMFVVPLHAYITRLDRTFSGEDQLQELFDHTSQAILRSLDTTELLELSTSAILEMLHATHVSIFLQEEPGGEYSCRATKFVSEANRLPDECRELSPHHILVRAVAQTPSLLSHDEVFRFFALDYAKPLAAAMAQVDVQLVAPLRWEDELVGLVCVGPKSSKEMYRPEEVEQLHNMIPQVSLALHNAQLYAEMATIKEYDETILREMDSGVIAVNSDGRVSLYNPAAERIIGLPREEVLNKELEILPTSIAQSLRRALVDGEVRSGDRFELRRADAQTVPIACSTSGLSRAPSEYTGAVAVINDLSVIQELERERQEAERLGLMRVLTAGMAHEIRNPLVTIRTFAELLPSRLDDAEFRSTFLETTQDEIERIDQLVSQLLMLSKPAGAVSERVNINDVCRAVVRSASAQAEAREIQFTTNLTALANRPVGDESRLHQVVVNLVNNALEAEPAGGRITVSTDEIAGGDGRCRVLIRVHNAGSYLPPAEVDKVFKPFYTRRVEGTGLGLAICQTIIEEHNGTIRVHSEPGQGTTFVVELPAETADQSPESEKP